MINESDNLTLTILKVIVMVESIGEGKVKVPIC